MVSVDTIDETQNVYITVRLWVSANGGRSSSVNARRRGILAFACVACQLWVVPLLFDALRRTCIQSHPMFSRRKQQRNLAKQ